ncbi:MAG: SIR2 family protein [Burkholderiales bacterium]|nr:SIR2 family protein [Burkholderiales bacterium]
MNTVLLVGAGFSRNWGCWLAPELTGDLLGRLAHNPVLHGVMRTSGGFEKALATVQSEYLQHGTDDAKGRLDDLQAAVMASFRAMNESLIHKGLDFNDDLLHGVRRFLSRFDAIFSLNQDLLLEMHYKPFWSDADTRFQSSYYPGMVEESNFLAQYDVDQIWYPDWEWDLQPRRQPIFKLHGSVNWRDTQGGSIMVLGADKAKSIKEKAILHWYAAEFRAHLMKSGTRLMVIGYSFGDDHINSVIREAGQRGLQVFLVDPAGRQAVPSSVLNSVYLIGESLRPLTTTFGRDHLEWGKLARFFLDSHQQSTHDHT